MISDISSGNTATADVTFLIAFIVFCLAFLASLPVFVQGAPFVRTLACAGLACLALGWLVL